MPPFAKHGTPKRSAKRSAKHRGVGLIPPDSRRLTWRIRYRDPDTGAVRTEPVPAHVSDTADGRQAYAESVLQRIRRLREDIADGTAAPHADADMPLLTALGRYFGHHEGKLSSRTLRAYQDACEVFAGWAADNQLQTVRQLSRGCLKRFAASMAAQPTKHGKPQATRTVNNKLKAVGIALNWLYDAEITRLGRDDVRVGLQRVKGPKPDKRAYLTPEQIGELLSFARNRDVAKPYRAPIEPVLRFLLLSGLRKGELLALRCGDVQLRQGYFDIRAADAKTRTGRTVRLDVAPSMAAILAEHITGKPPQACVFDRYTQCFITGTLRRMLRKHFPGFNYQTLRVTCATYLANMQSVGVVNESVQLGHSITVAQAFYLGRVRVAPDVHTLEQAYCL